MAVAIPLLETKLAAPRPQRHLVSRPRLLAELARGAESKLTLLSAPAGFGKTTLLAEWLATASHERWSTAWLSLDPADDRPGISFWQRVISSLQRAVPGVGEIALARLHSARSSTEAVLTDLLNDLDVLQNEVLLVLDDYHVIDATEIQEGIAFLLQHLPGHVHLTIASRSDPALSLGRLRGRGELVEIRAVDLRFSREEAGAYLNGTMGLDLDPPDVAILEGRTEGWIAALQLAALSIQGRDDISGFIARFAGDDRYVVDYLVEEVLRRQPDRVRHFLLRTSILDRLTGSLCEAVTGQEGGNAMLQALDRANLFMVPLDDQRRWYRYYHLFADVLRVHLQDEQPDRLPELHRRASAWHERHGDPSEAIRHALAGCDFDRAADMIELAIPAMRQARQETTVRRWLDALPDRYFRVRPMLAIGYVGSRLVSGDLEGVEARLSDAERWVGDATESPKGLEPTATDMVVLDHDGFRRLPGAVAIYRAALARASGDTAATLTHALRALDVIGEKDHLERGGAAGFLGLAYWTSGELEAAHGYWADAAASLEMAGHVSDALACFIALADLRISQGRLREAMATYERGSRLATVPGSAPHRGASDMHVGMSEVFLERNELPSAKEHLRWSGELGEHGALAQNGYRSRAMSARVREAEGDLEGALELLGEAERTYVSDYFPEVCPIPARRARLWIAQGRWSEVAAWAREQHVSVDEELSFLREFDHITLARLLLARSAKDGADRSNAALGLLERLLESAERGERGASIIDVLVLQAHAHLRSANRVGAMSTLERALVLAELEGHVRIFVAEGPALAGLIRDAAKSAGLRGYAEPSSRHSSHRSLEHLTNEHRPST